MGKPGKHIRDGRQGDLLGRWRPVETPAGLAEGQLDCGARLRAALSRAIKDCPLSRPEIAARMSYTLGRTISVAQIDGWTSPAHDAWRFPMEFAAAFEEATGCHVLQELLAAQRGTLVMTRADGDDAELGRAQRELRAAQDRVRSLMRGTA